MISNTASATFVVLVKNSKENGTNNNKPPKTTYAIEIIKRKSIAGCKYFFISQKYKKSSKS